MDSLANRYSSALLSIAVEENKLIEYQNAGKVLHKGIKENPDYIKVLSSRFMDKKEKYKLVDELISPFELVNLSNFLKVIIDNQREHEILVILKDFNSLCNEEQGIDEGIIYSTIKLSDEEIDQIENGISKKLGKKVELTNIIDYSIIGGVKVVVKDKVFDGSVARKVTAMKDSLLKGGNM